MCKLCMCLSCSQDAPENLAKYLKESEPVFQAFALVAEHGSKTLNRLKALLEE